MTTRNARETLGRVIGIPYPRSKQLTRTAFDLVEQVGELVLLADLGKLRVSSRGSVFRL